jgi:hypothetical protein
MVQKEYIVEVNYRWIFLAIAEACKGMAAKAGK